ncbi:MAG: stage II sporulation protein M [Bacilli bacterium]|nr:stage II sporulation protein M [Bacilli bacterium]
MNIKKKKLSNIIIPNKKINYFVITVLLFGVISGSIFLIILNETDKNNTILQIQNFITNLNNNTINNGLALKNSLIINYLFIFLIWGLGLSIIGIIINIFLTYIKGFIIGFSLSSIFLTYKYKGLLMAITYIFPSQLLNIIIVCILTIYSIMFSLNLLEIIIKKRINKHNHFLKKYIIILLFSIIISFISSIIEVYMFPNILKAIINIYLKS